MTEMTRRDGLKIGLAALAAAGAGTAARASSDVQEVAIQGFKYVPETITVRVGDTVRWTNADRAPHTATDRGRAWDTGRLNRRESGAVTMTEPGEYAYFCVFHPAMRGTVIVTA